MAQKMPQIPQHFQVMLQKAPKDLNKTELAIMGPLSHYNFWLAEARTNALEVLKYQKLLETANPLVNKEDLNRIISCRKSAVLVCFSKAKAALKEAYRTEKLQALKEAERKQKLEEERRSFREKKKAEAEAKAQAEAQPAPASEAEESEEPAA